MLTVTTVTFQPFPAFFPYSYSVMKTGRQPLLCLNLCSSVALSLPCSPLTALFQAGLLEDPFPLLVSFFGCSVPSPAFSPQPWEITSDHCPGARVCHMKCKLLVTLQRAPGTSPHPVCHCLAGDIRVPISDAPESSTTLPAFQTNL